ncbi:MAG: flagellar protein FlaF [Methanomicrobiales archaeon]|jgi:flagellar protein FlaF|nr:flagellar protein FlaF [Methanomicrobiales archaeon]MDD1639908.1 flagellar protein FlaF [Methanomicrobiales archaeon]MDD1645081.1 flagellar protein FlaF [Methanomicrobiales archaeon]MDD1646857.1 flagellar protein FlaF [Methanomicrobiales archaeon]MDD1648179.1 flagellar protein FlaF [Methanomicrobiales archaeon]
MSAATLIASAVGILILIITAYVVMGGTITLVDTVTASQKALTERQVDLIHTRIEITGASADDILNQVFLDVENTGSETVTGLDGMAVLLLHNGEPIYYTNSSGAWWYRISPDTVHPNQLDPDEVMNLSVTYTGDTPTWVKVVTENGVYDSAYL